MAFVPGFLHDVFISYACADDDSAGGLVRHFWKIFTDALRAEGLRIQSDDNPGGVDVFLDRRSLQSADDLTQQVLTSARSSAVFVAFHSTAYIASNWCQREATEFTSNYDSKRPHLNGRLFVIALGQRGSPAQSDIGLLRSRRYRRFYYVNDDGNDFPFNPQEDDRRNQDGYNLKEEAVKLAREVADTLKEMQRETPPRASSSPTPRTRAAPRPKTSRTGSSNTASSSCALRLPPAIGRRKAAPSSRKPTSLWICTNPLHTRPPSPRRKSPPISKSAACAGCPAES
jgi:hypothetical protein